MGELTELVEAGGVPGFGEDFYVSEEGVLGDGLNDSWGV